MDCLSHQHLESDFKQRAVLPTSEFATLHSLHCGCDLSQLTYITITWKSPVPDVCMHEYRLYPLAHSHFQFCKQ